MRYVIYLFFFFNIFSSAAQSPIYFNKTYDYEKSIQILTGLVQLDSTSYIGIVNSKGLVSSKNKLLFYKFNLKGEITKFNFIHEDTSLFIIQRQGIQLIKNNSTFLLSGQFQTKIGINQAMIVLLNTNGDSLLVKKYASSAIGDYSGFSRAISCPDKKSYLAAGFTHLANDKTRVYLVKLDSVFNPIWEKKYGNDSYQAADAIVSTNDGGYIISGLATVGTTEYKLFFKIDANGKQLWTKKINNNSKYTVYTQLANLKDGNFLLATAIVDSLTQIGNSYLQKFDTKGNTIWEKHYIDSTETAFSTRPLELADGSLVIGGGRYVLNPVNNKTSIHTHLTKITKDGTLLWQRLYKVKQDNNQYFWGVIPTQDKGFLAYGFAVPETQDAWLVKTDSLGCEVENCVMVTTEEIPEKEYRLRCSPNPAQEEVTVYYKLPDSNSTSTAIVLYTLTGQKLYSIRLGNDNKDTITVDVSTLPVGIYIYALEQEGKTIAHQKIAIAR